MEESHCELQKVRVEQEDLLLDQKAALLLTATSKCLWRTQSAHNPRKGKTWGSQAPRTRRASQCKIHRPSRKVSMSQTPTMGRCVSGPAHCWVRTPFEDAICPCRRSSCSVARRRARANALNVASTMWCEFFPASCLHAGNHAQGESTLC